MTLSSFGFRYTRVVREVTLRASRTAVRGGESSEVRVPMAVASGIGRSEPPAFRCGGWGEPQPIVRELQQFGEHALETTRTTLAVQITEKVYPRAPGK